MILPLFKETTVYRDNYKMNIFQIIYLRITYEFLPHDEIRRLILNWQIADNDERSPQFLRTLIIIIHI